MADRVFYLTTGKTKSHKGKATKITNLLQLFGRLQANSWVFCVVTDDDCVNGRRNQQVARLRLIGYSLGFRRLVAMHQTPSVGTLQPTRGYFM